MAKSKNSKILAMALCASVMAGIYASPVMAADIKVEKGSTLNGVTISNSTDYTITSGTLKLDGADIANALNGKNINLGTGSLIINDKNIGNSVAAIRRVVNKDTGMSATYLEETVKAHSAFGLQVLDKDGEAVATISRGGSGTFNGTVTTQDVNSNAHSVLSSAGLQLYNADGTNKVNITNSGASRFGSFDETNVRIEGGALKIMAPNNEPDAAVSGPLVAQLSEDGLTLVDADRKYSTLTAAQLANLNSTIKEGGVVDANELNVSGASGGLYVRDVDDGKTMIYTKAADADGTNTVWIDPENGNISTIGTVGVTDDLESGKLITQIQGSGENIGDIAVGIQYDGEGNITGQNIVLDASTGDIIAKGDVTTLNDDGSEKYSLNAIGKQVGNIGADLGENGRLGGITRTDEIGNDKILDTTTIEGTTSFDANGMRVTNENDGRAVAITKDRGIEVFGGDGASNAVITNNGTARFGDKDGANVRIENGDVTSTYYYEDGKVGHYSLNNIGDKTQNMWADGSQTNFSHSVNVEGSFSAGNGGAQLNGAWGKEASLKLRDAGDKTYTLTATQLGNINNVILENGVVNGAAGSNIGGVRFSGGGDLNDVNHINGAEVQGWGDGGLEISGVAMENGAIKVNAINGATVNYYGEGGLEISGVGMLNGNVSAQTFNGVSIEKDTDGSAVIGGIDLGNLNENVTAVTENIAGIERIDKDGDGTKETTTIEGRLVVNKEELVIGGYGEGNSLTIKAVGARFAGNVVFNNGYDVSFSYGENGSKGTSLGKLAEGFDNLNAKVDDIYDRTQGISRDEDGNTVISNDERTWNEETGTSEVTDNDGATITVGDDVNVDGGNLNVNNGDLNVGTSGEGGSGSGEGGSTGGNGGNGNFSSDINVGGNANVNGTVTVGDASDGKYTQVVESGMTIVGEDKNGNTTTNNISDKGMTITGKDDNGNTTTNNISDKGMTITGDNGTNNISDSGMTVTGDNGTTNISGGDISVDNSVTVAGGSENKTTINNEGITVGDKGTSIKNDSISVGDGGYIGDGDVRSGEGVSLNDTAERVGHLENRVGELEDRIDKVGAMAAAIANLRTMGYDPAAPTEVAVGIGQYRDETGAALGLFHYPNRDFMLSLSVSTSGDEVMGGIGATWKFGRKSPEKVAEIKKAQAEADARRAEEAKLAKAEEMKQAAKEAKIKAQQERHAKLAAERAAQAEAAK